ISQNISRFSSNGMGFYTYSVWQKHFPGINRYSVANNSFTRRRFMLEIPSESNAEHLIHLVCYGILIHTNYVLYVPIAFLHFLSFGSLIEVLLISSHIEVLIYLHCEKVLYFHYVVSLSIHLKTFHMYQSFISFLFLPFSHGCKMTSRDTTTPSPIL
ncbi:hypothetical protein L9F63_007640, partial [Diploptera punctata]